MVTQYVILLGVIFHNSIIYFTHTSGTTLLKSQVLLFSRAFEIFSRDLVEVATVTVTNATYGPPRSEFRPKLKRFSLARPYIPSASSMREAVHSLLGG